MPPTDEVKEEAERHWKAVAFRGAVDKGDMETVETMLQEGMNPKYEMKDGATWTVLMLAAKGGHLELTNLLSKGGRMPKVDDKDPNGYQAIMLAALGGHTSIVTMLLEKKADLNAKSEDGETPLMMAAAQGHTEVVKILLEAGADPDARDKNDMSAVKKASRWGRADCVEAFIGTAESRYPKLFQIVQEANAEPDKDMTSMRKQVDNLVREVEDDDRQLKHCYLFGKLYGHDGVVQVVETFRGAAASAAKSAKKATADKEENPEDFDMLAP